MADSGPVPRVPTVGGDPRDRNHVQELSGKSWFRELDEAVIEADRCIQCGTCIAACPSNSIGIDSLEDRPTLVRMCTGCSRCWDFCPRSGLRYERLLELEAADRPAGVGGAYAARAVDTEEGEVGQDGGVVTALLGSLLEANEIDGALVVRERADAALKGEAYLATSREELIASAGSRYNQTMQLGRLEALVADLDADDPAIAVVGTPCVIQGAAALERYPWADDTATIALTIALMCTRNFEHERLRSLLAAHGVEVEAVDRLDVTDGVLSALDGEGQRLLEEPVESFDPAALDGCIECADFVGAAADLSAGSVGSEDGYTTVLVQSERGARAWERASGSIEVVELNGTETVDRLDRWNRRRAREALPREFDPAGQLSITYQEHRNAYDDTDRAPQPLNPARVYQYEEWC